MTRRAAGALVVAAILYVLWVVAQDGRLHLANWLLPREWLIVHRKERDRWQDDKASHFRDLAIISKLRAELRK